MFGQRFLVVFLLLAGVVSTAVASVSVNGRALTSTELSAFAATYGNAPEPGAYWYDARSGLYGFVGAAPAGRINPGHDYGPLAANASHGTSGLFINGRQLPQQEVAFYAQMFGRVQPGRYWLDANGNVGFEGQSQPIANLFGGAAALNGAPGASAAPVTGRGNGAPTYTDNEGYTWERHTLSCQLNEGPAELILDVSYVQDVGLTWDTSKRPSPEISGVIGLDQQIRYMQGEFRLGGQTHRFKGRGDMFTFRETLDNSMTGRFELQGQRLAVYYPFSNPQPGFCTPKK